MVDEFQDTNRLQYSLVQQIARKLQADERVAIVGDQKQSIYGFRGAEVEVFSRATNDFKVVNREKQLATQPLAYRDESIEPESREEGLGELNLSASFRLLPCRHRADATLQERPRFFRQDPPSLWAKPAVFGTLS